MRRLQDIKGLEAMDVLADLLDPVTELVKKPEILKVIDENGLNDIETIKALIKGGKMEVLQILAILDGRPIEEFLETFDILTLPVMLYQTFNDDALQAVFTSQGQNEAVKSSGLAMESTQETEEM
jgi:hypothetical protein